MLDSFIPLSRVACIGHLIKGKGFRPSSLALDSCPIQPVWLPRDEGEIVSGEIVSREAEESSHEMTVYDTLGL
ncbi:hypothetical protein [Caldalkalibacillus thermarum]|nr:hypothetical protein [Caldalkalibacillus thermarum]